MATRGGESRAATRSHVPAQGGAVYEQRGSLLDLDPDLGAELGGEEAATARKWLHVPLVRIPTGASEVDELLERAEAAAALVVAGVLVHRVTLAGHTAAELVGPGDVITRAPDEQLTHPVLMPEVAWSCEEGATLVLIAERMKPSFARWPALDRAFEERHAARLARLATLHAIAQIPRAEERLLLLLWLLAERFGRVTGEGVVLDLSLRYRLIGELIGARRSTVSLAMKDLRERGLVVIRSDGGLVLPEPPPDAPLAARPPASA